MTFTETGKGNIYFASDFHLGAPNAVSSKARERNICAWLEKHGPDMAALILVGDVFDFWFDYKTVVPKGYVRLLGALAKLTDAGIPVYWFTGNHDMWMFGYAEEELGIKVIREPVRWNIRGQSFLVAHGDGLGPDDHLYKFTKKVFANKLCQWAFGWIHPDWGSRLASYLSRRSRARQMEKGGETFVDKNKEWLYLYACRKLSQSPEIDYFIFGHRHLAMDILLPNDRSRYLNLGTWLEAPYFAVFDGKTLRLMSEDGDLSKVVFC